MSVDNETFDASFDDYTSFFESDESDTTPDKDNQETPDSKEDKKEDTRLKELEEINKNQREMIRQLGEELKELKEWRDRIVGKSQEDISKQEELALRERFEEDNIGVVNELIEKRVNEIERKLNEQIAITNVKEAMDEIDREYYVNWDRDYPKIIEQLNNFSPEAKQRDPKGILLAACRLAGVIKKRDNSIPTYIEGVNRYGIPKKGKTEKDIIRDRIKGYSEESKKDNIFKI